MKVLKYYLLPIFVLILLSGCTEEKLSVEALENTHEHSNIIQNQHLSISSIDSLSDLVTISDNIVIGKVLDAEKHDDMNTYKFTFSVKDELKGKVESTLIDVYESLGSLQIDKEYILFLEFWESVLYPKPVYTSIDKNTLIEISQNKLIGGEILVGNSNLKQLKEKIKSSMPVAAAAVSKADTIIEKAADLDELISISENIVHIVPKTVILENSYVKMFDVNVLKTFKGTINEEIIVLNLPSDVELENEYIVFLKDGNLATREGSIISKENEEQWQEILREFSQ